MSEGEDQVLAEPDRPAPPKVDPETLVLRARPARAIRFKRSIIVSLVAIAATGVVGTAWFALEPRALHLASSADDQPFVAKSPTGTLNALPSGYRWRYPASTRRSTTGCTVRNGTKSNRGSKSSCWRVGVLVRPRNPRRI